MAVPKRKLSRSNTHARRAQWKATATTLVEARRPDGERVEVPRRLVRAVQRGLL